MAIRTQARKGFREKQIVDRRAARSPGARGTINSLRRLKSLLVRPFKLEWQGRRLRLVLVERRRARPVDQPPSLAQLRADLQARLMAQEYESSGPVMRHLGLVHDELGRSGWAGIERLSSRVIDLALVQAEVLAAQEPMPSLAIVIDRLRILKVAVALREERASRLRNQPSDNIIEVSEATREEFEESELSWARSVPATPESPDRDK
jgi:hypothetical protein